jgi:hypothetical protein
VIWAGGTQGFRSERAPTHGDARDAGGVGRGDVEGSVTDVGGSFWRDVAE